MQSNRNILELKCNYFFSRNEIKNTVLLGMPAYNANKFYKSTVVSIKIDVLRKIDKNVFTKSYTQTTCE